MREAVFPESIQPTGLTPEDEQFLPGSLDARGRALQVAHHHIGSMQYGVDLLGKEAIYSVMLNGFSHAPVQQDVAGEDERGDPPYCPRGGFFSYSSPFGWRKGN